MKKKILLLILITTLTINAFSEALFNDLPGSYVIYNDERFNDQAYIGLLYLGSDKVLVRTYEENTANEFVFIVTMVIEDNKFSFANDMEFLYGKLGSSETTQRILPMILNWGNAWYESRSFIEENLSYSAQIDDTYSYQYWIPILNIEDISYDPDFSLITAGMVKDINDPAFAQFDGVSDWSQFPAYKINIEESNDVLISHFLFTLDQNWVKEKDGVYRIKQESDQDAALMIEQVDLETIPYKSDKDLAKIIMLSSSSAYSMLLADKSKIYQQDGHLYFENCVLDYQSNAISYQKSKYVLDGNIMSIISLASFYDLYEMNSEYFDKILE